jgi:hypothetical protein
VEQRNKRQGQLRRFYQKKCITLFDHEYVAAVIRYTLAMARLPSFWLLVTSLRGNPLTLVLFQPGTAMPSLGSSYIGGVFSVPAFGSSEWFPESMARGQGPEVTWISLQGPRAPTLFVSRLCPSFRCHTVPTTRVGGHLCQCRCSVRGANIETP